MDLDPWYRTHEEKDVSKEPQIVDMLTETMELLMMEWDPYKPDDDQSIHPPHQLFQVGEFIPYLVTYRTDPSYR